MNLYFSLKLVGLCGFTQEKPVFSSDLGRAKLVQAAQEGLSSLWGKVHGWLGGRLFVLALLDDERDIFGINMVFWLAFFGYFLICLVVIH